MAGYGKADYTIKNGLIEAGINKKGAELVSLVRIKDGRQYMWNVMLHTGTGFHLFYFRL